MTDETTAATTAPVAKPAKAKRAPSPKKAEPFTLADRARELNVSPKVARATFRRLFAKKDAKHPKRVSPDGWAFPPTERAAVDAILKSIKS